MAMGIKHVMWYTISDGIWHSHRQCADNLECNFGIVYADLTPKPAYIAYGTMTEHLEDATFQGRLELGDDDLYGFGSLPPAAWLTSCGTTGRSTRPISSRG